jgi:hypothetical protein
VGGFAILILILSFYKSPMLSVKVSKEIPGNIKNRTFRAASIEMTLDDASNHDVVKGHSSEFLGSIIG